MFRKVASMETMIEFVSGLETFLIIVDGPAVKLGFLEFLREQTKKFSRKPKNIRFAYSFRHSYSGKPKCGAWTNGFWDWDGKALLWGQNNCFPFLFLKYLGRE